MRMECSIVAVLAREGVSELHLYRDPYRTLSKEIRKELQKKEIGTLMRAK